MQPNTDIDPNAPWSPEELAEVPAEKKTELRNVQSSLPIIEEVLAWFDEQIAIFKNPMTIEGVNISSKAEDVKSAVLFAQSQISAYKYKRNEFEKRFEEYIQVVTEG